MKKKWKKLVLTEVSPSGWLKEQMQMQMNGLTGCLHEKWDSVGTYSGWLGGTGESWERGPYYLDGLLPLSYYLKDEKRFEICKKFLDWTLKSQDNEGNFGPEQTKEDYWSRFIMLKVMIQYYEITKKEEIIEFIENYLKYLKTAIEDRHLTGWTQARTGDVLYVIKWLYERFPAEWMMDLQREIRRQAIDWTSLFADFPYPRPTAHYYDWNALKRFQNEEVEQLMQYHQTHVVNVSMGLKYAAMEYFFDGDDEKKKLGIEAPGIVVKGIHDVAVRFSKCCSPVPGDEIVGFVTRGRGISIHRTDCINVLNLPEIERARLIEAEWEPSDTGADGEKYMAEINIFAHNRNGLLADISKALTERNIDIQTMNTRTNKQGIATLSTSFEISSREELNQIVAKLRNIESVIDIERTTG